MPVVMDQHISSIEGDAKFERKARAAIDLYATLETIQIRKRLMLAFMKIHKCDKKRQSK